MFTGLVEIAGVVEDAKKSGDRLRLRVRVPWEDLVEGESVAVDGVCLTAVNVNQREASFDVVGETLKRTTLGTREPGDPLNLERALRAGDRFGGHFVTGHIDGVGRVEHVTREGGDLLYTFSAPKELMREIAEKGSIAVDGISLTVMAVDKSGFTCTIIPHTMEHSTLGDRGVGDAVNLETDVLAKYARRAAGK
jgi:riboflavin synthase